MDYVIHLFFLFLEQKVFVENLPRHVLSMAPLHLYLQGLAQRMGTLETP